jgi:hypothetical protein
VSCTSGKDGHRISHLQLSDKIKGGWAGQTIGCTYGGPTEFKYNGRTIPDSVVIPWPEHHIKWYFDNEGGLYDDVYMDLTFVDVFQKEGLDAPAKSFADAFANATYNLWHANQAARYNILGGIPAPASGHWKNNPHADDIDFQIEADFAGLMAPGMPNVAAAICDPIGHIMNYGNGYYGGVYVAAMYSMAFVENDPAKVVKEAIKIIPEGSAYRECIDQTIQWCEQNPDWKTTWQLVEDNWSDETTCPKGTKDPFNIEATVNSAYVVMALLYGGGDFDRTMDIATRCGADSDCNPATACGILGTMIGYDRIPEKWMPALREVEDMDFDHTDISLNEAYKMSFDQALLVIERGGGELSADHVTIPVGQIEPVALEQSFEGLALVSKSDERYNNFRKPYRMEFDGTGVVFAGRVKGKNRAQEDTASYVAQMEITVDGNPQIVEMPLNFAVRKTDIYWNYELPEGHHKVEMRWLNPIPDHNVILESTLIYTSKE